MHWDRAGYTLIEVVMVVLLVAILASVGVSQYHDFSSSARRAVTLQKLSAIKAAIVGDGRFTAAGIPTKPGYEANCQSLPSNTLAELVTQPLAGVCSAAYNPYTKIGWRGPYVSDTDPNWKKDGWGVDIRLVAPRTLRSCGPDETCGTGDDIDVTF